MLTLFGEQRKNIIFVGTAKLKRISGDVGKQSSRGV